MHAHVLVGLPETGKTTFLAALWHVVCAQEFKTDLRLERCHGDQGYLNAIRERWANAEIQTRTTPSTETCVSMILASDSIDGEIEVRVPDLSGESYESAWSYRQLNREQALAISTAGGVLLFVHPDRITKETLISQTADIIDDLDEEEEDQEEDAPETIPWDPQLTPTQVQLVDLVQCILRLNTKRPIPIGVLVSAWDRIVETIPPAQWFQRELPLLWQFLSSNSDTVESKVFGVSAQGGQLPADAERLRELDRPGERIRIVSEDGSLNGDITLPLRWLLTAVEA